VDQEIGQRLGVECLLVLVERLAELGQRVELLAALEVELGIAQRGVIGSGDGCGDGQERERDQESGQGHFLRNGSSVSDGSIGGGAGGGLGATGSGRGGSLALC